MATTFQINGEFPTETRSSANANPRLEPGFSLPVTFRLRNAQRADAEPVAQLILDVCTKDGDPSVATSLDELRNEWSTPGFNLETDAWVVTTADGQVVGYEELFNQYAHASLRGDGYVHPDFEGKGIGTALLHALETRARKEIELAEPEHRVFIRNAMESRDVVAREMHETEGYQPVRYTWRMEIELDEPPPESVWPEGIELCSFDLEGHDYLVYRAHQDAFRDHWGFAPRSYEFWQHHMVEDEAFDPSLWHIAWDGDQIAGYALCRIRNGNPWIGTLGVLRPWRKRGLGLALLYHSFGEFYKQGERLIMLGVDSENPNGATRLYQKAGMHVASEYVFYEKELRTGREPNVETTSS
ncbi:MAG: GNAT family N-acetyltransferase [Anaerolineales bacterium]|jgi:mycothiol synthase